MIDEYAQLKKIIADTITALETTQTFNTNLFLSQMENAFKAEGFRENATDAPIKNILLVRPDAAGDFILTTPAIRAVRENFPKAHITLIVSKKVYKLAELCPYVNEVLAVEEQRNLDYLKSFVHAANFSAAHLWKRHFDLAICLGIIIYPLRYLLTYLSGARERVTFFFDGPGKKFYTHCYDKDDPRYCVHDVLISLYLLKAHGLKLSNTTLEIWFNGADLYTARRLLKNFGEGRIKVAVGIGAGVPERKYPVEKYLVALKKIIDKGASILILGGPSELDDAKFLEDNLPKEFVKNFVELNADWRLTSAAISLSDLYLGNDTGTQHVAAALNKPVIVLSRVARDIREFFKYIDESLLYSPWQTPSIVLKPAHQLEECRAKPNYQGCTALKPHCIAQIGPSEIVDAFDVITDFIHKNYLRGD